MATLLSNPATHPPAFAALVALTEDSEQGMDRKLGYRGKDRFVVFYYEPRRQEMVWRDSRSFGFSTGAGQLFIDELAPIAELHDVDLGTNGSPSIHALLIDGAYRRAYFVEKVEAMRFLANVAKKHAGDSGTSLEEPPLASLATLVEITQRSIRRLICSV